MCAPHDVLSNAGDLPRDGCGGASRPIDAESERDELGAVRARKGHKVVRDYAALDKPAAPLRRPPVEIAPRPPRRPVHDREAIGRKGGRDVGERAHGQKPTLSPPFSERISRASSGEAASSPSPSMIWRTRVTCAALLGASTPLSSHRLSSRPTRTWPPIAAACAATFIRSEEHTYELQSLMRISYAVFCLTTKNKHSQH